MKKKSEKQQDLDKLKTELAKVSTVILTHLPGHHRRSRHQVPPRRAGCGRQVSSCEEHPRRTRRTGTPAENVLKNLKGTHSIAYTQTDPVALAKALTKVAKDVPAFQFKSGVVEGRVISIAEIQQLANMPSKEELISKIMFLLNAPAQRIAIGAQRAAAQPRGHRQRSGQGQQVWFVGVGAKRAPPAAVPKSEF